MDLTNVIVRGKYPHRNLHTEKNLKSVEVSIRGEVEVLDDKGEKTWRDCVWNMTGNNIYPNNLMLDLILAE